MDDFLHILLIEDSLEDADLLKEFIEDANQTNWKLVVIETLTDALDCLNRQQFDVILSDLSLPDAYGLAAITELHAAVPAIPIVVLTGLQDEDVALEAVRQGAQDYLVKGQISAHSMVRSIRYAVERSRMQQVMHWQSVAIATSTEGIAILSPQWKYIYVNAAYAKIYGYDDPSTLHHCEWAIHYSASDYTRLTHEVEENLQQKGFWRGEAIGLQLKGQPFTQELSITALPFGGTVCMLRNISKRKQAEEALQVALQQSRELHQLKSNFITTVSHEFRTPLSIILASTESLKRYAHQWTQEKVYIRYERIITAVQRMTGLLNEMLFMNRAGNELLPFNPVLLNVDRFCQELIATFNTRRPIQFSSQGCDRPIYLDPSLLHPMLTQLLSNAIKYSSDDSPVKLSVQCTLEHVTFQVQDEGIGIPIEDQDKLLVPFHRGSNVGNRSGTGMGLAIVQQCVERCSGNIHVSSQVNRGTLVTITCPIASTSQTHDQDSCN